MMTRCFSFCFTMILCGILLGGCKKIPPYDADAAVIKMASLADYQEYTIKDDNGDAFHLVETGNRDAPLVVFVHGAPGNWQAWGDYLADPDLRARAHLIAVDRLGYSKSYNETWTTSLPRHARSLTQIVAKVAGEKPAVWIGHSYGGPVVIQIGLDQPKQVRASILLAPSIDPDLEETQWYQYVATAPIIRSVVPAPLFVAAKEILPLKPELLNQRTRMTELSKPMTVIQGMDDNLVPHGNADYLKITANNALVQVIKIEKEGHFIPWKQFDLVKKTILKTVE